MPTEITFRGSRQGLRHLLGGVPQMLSGAASDPHGVRQGLQLRLGNALLSKIQQDFITKSRGGVGEDGIQWQPLKRATIAQRRIGAGDLQAVGIKGRSAKSRKRGLLSAKQDKRWKGIFASQKARLMAKFGMDEASASGKAAMLAWGILKRDGAQTKLDVLGGRQVDILRDTGELFRSLTPGIEDKPSNEDGQVLRSQPGQVIVGTNKKAWHHRGTKHIPARPLWPDELPESWWRELTAAYRRGLLQAFVLIVTGRL